MPALRARLLDLCAPLGLGRIDTVGSHSRTFDAKSEAGAVSVADRSANHSLATGVMGIVARPRRRDQESEYAASAKITESVQRRRHSCVLVPTKESMSGSLTAAHSPERPGTDRACSRRMRESSSQRGGPAT